MTIERAKELVDDVYVKLKRMLEMNHYEQIFINVGKTYMLAMEKSKQMLTKYNVYWANGQIGERLHQLKNWLKLISAEMESAQ